MFAGVSILLTFSEIEAKIFLAFFWNKLARNGYPALVSLAILNLYSILKMSNVGMK